METNMEIKLKTLTPIWTGGVETGRMDRLHETGIIGSLRWWYEAIVRGLGGSACDPTSDNPEHRCQFDAKAYEGTKNIEDGLSNVCSICRLFGCTGWRRRFRLIASDTNLSETWSGGVVNIKPPDRNRGWYLNAGKVGTFDLKIVADAKTQARVLALVQFIDRWGSLGARPQLGYGFMEIIGVNKQPDVAHDWNTIGNGKIDRSLPDLRTFTFFSLDFEPQRDDWWRDVPGIGALARNNRYRSTIESLINQRMIPTTPALKNVLRFGQQWSSSALPHQFFGTLRGNERRRSKIALSWAYQPDGSSIWRIRGWAHPPQVAADQQQEIQQRLQAVLGRPETLLRALNIRYRSAEISFAPATNFFQATTSAEIESFIQETTAKVRV